MSGSHLSLGLSRELWSEMLREALPFQLADGTFSLAGAARTAWAQLAVRERVAGLLEDHRTPATLQRVGARALEVWHDHREAVLQRLDGLVHVEGTWTLDVDDLGTEIGYGHQKVSADAWVKGVAEGKLTLLREDLVVPFRIEKRVGASVALGRIRFSREQDAVIGNVQDLALHLGDHVVLQLLSRLIEQVAEQRLDMLKAVPILKREQVEGMVGPLGGGLRVHLGVSDLQLDVTEETMMLHVRFGFDRLASTPQLEQGDA
jgi:hypothetical protein